MLGVTIGACANGNTDCKFSTWKEKDLMGDKVALPSLSLPKQKTHWSVGVAVAAATLFLFLCAALYAVLQRQQAAEEAFAKRQADRAAMIKAETEKAKAETDRAVAEAKKKEAETAAAAAAAAAARSKPALASAGESSSKSKSSKRRSAHKGGKTSASSEPSLGSAPKAQSPKAQPSSKASKDIDDLLRGFK